MSYVSLSGVPPPRFSRFRKPDYAMTVLADATADPTMLLLWCGAAAVLLFALVGGFFAGVICAPWLQEWAVRRASAQVHKMYALVIAEAERAQRMCAELAAASGCQLSALEWQRMERLQGGFQETFAQIAKSSGINLNADADAHAAAKSKDFTMDWVKLPVDPASGLPDKQAFELNLANLVSRGAEANLESGLLMIRMDKADGLRRRLGNEAVEKLLGRLASLVVRAARDRDVICRLSGDTFGLLCPALPPLAGCKVAEKIRETIRNYHFRVEDGGPEILVTASFGYANCSPTDTPDLVRDRAGDGLARSESLGRNQLHVHDGQLRALCRA